MTEVLVPIAGATCSFCDRELGPKVVCFDCNLILEPGHAHDCPVNLPLGAHEGHRLEPMRLPASIAEKVNPR